MMGVANATRVGWLAMRTPTDYRSGTRSESCAADRRSSAPLPLADRLRRIASRSMKSCKSACRPRSHRCNKRASNARWAASHNSRTNFRPR